MTPEQKNTLVELLESRMRGVRANLCANPAEHDFLLAADVILELTKRIEKLEERAILIDPNAKKKRPLPGHAIPLFKDRKDA